MNFLNYQSRFSVLLVLALLVFSGCTRVVGSISTKRAILEGWIPEIGDTKEEVLSKLGPPSGKSQGNHEHWQHIYTVTLNTTLNPFLMVKCPPSATSLFFSGGIALLFSDYDRIDTWIIYTTFDEDSRVIMRKAVHKRSCLTHFYGFPCTPKEIFSKCYYCEE